MISPGDVSDRAFQIVFAAGKAADPAGRLGLRLEGRRFLASWGSWCGEGDTLLGAVEDLTWRLENAVRMYGGRRVG